ncbi:MAG: PCMD domain-containing protein, partial [Muribaculaceae bacterium]|nr:PCMD domain-containing protein [Muribaculaceae bacterium]
SRATLSSEEEQGLPESSIIWISNSKGLMHEYIGASQVPSSLRLFAGHYTAEAWVGDSVPASWDKTFYKSGFQGFDIASGKDTEVALTCRVANTLASVSYSDAVLEVLSSPVMTVGLDDGITDGSHSLTFDDSNRDAKGRFMINSRTKGLVWTLTGTQVDGQTFTKSGVVENIKPATEYVLKVNFTGQDPTVGGAYLEVVVEEEPVGDNTQVEVVLPPTIAGMLGFDKNNTFRAEEGKVGRKSIFISAGAALDEVTISSSDIASVIGSESIEMLHIHDSYVSQLNAAGLNWIYFYEEEDDISAFRINLEEEFTDKLTEGDHVFEITAKDVKGKTSTATFTITITNAPAATAPVAESSITYTGATLEGTVLKQASEYGFELREATASRAYETWTRIKATVNGNRIYTQVNDLKPGTEYEYRVYADDFVSTETSTFKTLSYPQLPNSGFEDWNTSSSPYLLYTGGDANKFWDSGNHGSATMSKNVTVPDGSVKHSGNYSVKLASQFVGVGALGKFAAGNVFIGSYLKTDGTDGVLGWGRPWEFRPTAVRLWVKYSPVAVTSDNSSYTALQKGDMDNGIIYVALLTDNKTLATDSKGNTFGEWPVVIKTKSSERTLFDKNGSNVIGYGEMVFKEATAGADMIQVTIPIDYRSDAPVKNIMMVGSASIGGDYFVGGNGSTMWIDDIELVYE